MPRLIAAAAAALITAAPAHALDLSGGALRGATEQPDEVAWEKLADLDIAPRAAPNAEDQLDAMVAEDAALGIEPSAGFVPLGGGTATDKASSEAPDGAMGDIATEMTDDVPSGGSDRDRPDLGFYDPQERFVESIPVLAAPEADFAVVLPSSSASIAVLPSGGWGRSEWGTNNPRPSTVVMGGGWVSR